MQKPAKDWVLNVVPEKPVDSQNQSTSVPPELAEIVESWPRLPEPTPSAIWAIVKTAIKWEA